MMYNISKKPAATPPPLRLISPWAAAMMVPFFQVFWSFWRFLEIFESSRRLAAAAAWLQPFSAKLTRKHFLPWSVSLPPCLHSCTAPQEYPKRDFGDAFGMDFGRIWVPWCGHVGTIFADFCRLLDVFWDFGTLWERLVGLYRFVDDLSGFG